MAKKRKDVTKSTRFEVFKRDRFTCQYCGAEAPDAVLHVDHIEPISSGGDNEITNLITSCRDCNSGKGPRKLSDDAAVKKQRAQMEALQERREQIEMMADWRKGLAETEEAEAQIALEAFECECPDYIPSTRGMADVKKWIRKYGLEEVLICIKTSFEQYFECGDREETKDSWSHSFRMIPKIARSRAEGYKNGEIGRICYIRGILRNRSLLSGVDQREAFELIKNLVDSAEPHGLTNFILDEAEDAAKICIDYDHFERGTKAVIQKFEAGDVEDMKNA